MNKKILSLFLLTLISCLALASATFTASPSTLTFSQSVNSTAFTITNTNASELLSVTFNLPSIAGVSFNAPAGTATDINASAPRQFTLSPTTAIDYSKFVLGKIYSGNLYINNSVTPADSQTINVNIQKSFCSSGDRGTNLSLDNVDINNLGDGDETTWKPLDEIEIKVRIDNNNPTDGEKIDVNVEAALYNSNGKEVLDLDRIKLGTIRANDDKTATFFFEVPSDISSGSYKLYVKAYKSGDESNVCTSFFDSSDSKSISVDRYDDDNKQILFKDVSFDITPVKCNEEAALNLRAVNVGDSDQEKVKITLYNKELGVNLYNILTNLDQDDNPENIQFLFTIPQNAEEKVYKFELKSLYSYDDDYKPEDNNAYDDQSDSYYIDLKVEGACASTIPTTVITATLQSDAVAGQQIVVNANVLNSGTSSQAYTIVAAGTETFSTLESIDLQTFTLGAGQSRSVLITLNANDDASGDYTFTIKAISGSTITEQQVSLNVQGKSMPLSGLFGSLQNNWLIWVIVIVNIVLIALIIIIAVKLAKR